MKQYWWRTAAGIIGSFVISTVAVAQPVIDGTADASYGSALSVQNTQTHFGDNNLGDLIATANGGSEIDQVFGVITGGRLYVTVTGNLERNFNKLEVFIDSVAGGVNSINGTDLPAGVDAFCCGGFGTTGGALQQPGVNGLIFDTGFNADYYLTFTHGSEFIGTSASHELDFWALSAHFAELGNGTAGNVVRAGYQLGPQGLPNVLRANGMADTFADPAFVPNDGAFPTNPTTSLIGPVLPGLSQGELIDKNYALDAGECDDNTGAGCLAKELEFALEPNDEGNTRNHRDFDNTIDLRMALNNVNVEGVSGSSGPFELLPEDDPQNVTTGIEFSIPLLAIGNPNGPVKLTMYINGSTHDFASNQFSGVGVLTSNFGTLPPDLSTEAADDQFVTVPVAAGVPGDYNDNGRVDAADYVVWRNGGQLLNEVETIGLVTQEDYDAWRARFGNPLGSGSVIEAAAVPEPGTWAFALAAISGVCALARPKLRVQSCPKRC